MEFTIKIIFLQIPARTRTWTKPITYIWDMNSGKNVIMNVFNAGTLKITATGGKEGNANAVAAAVRADRNGGPTTMPAAAAAAAAERTEVGRNPRRARRGGSQAAHPTPATATAATPQTRAAPVPATTPARTIARPMTARTAGSSPPKRNERRGKGEPKES